MVKYNPLSIKNKQIEKKVAGDQVFLNKLNTLSKSYLWILVKWLMADAKIRKFVIREVLEMKEKNEKKHFISKGINLVLVGNERSKEVKKIEIMFYCIMGTQTFNSNFKWFNVIYTYKPEELDSIIAEADVIFYFDATEDEICHCEQLRETNPDCIAIDFVQTGPSFNDCLAKIEYLIEHAKSSKSQAKAKDQYKSELFWFGNRKNEYSALYALPTELADIIAVNQILNCNYTSLSFFKKMPEEQTIDKSSTLSLIK